MSALKPCRQVIREGRDGDVYAEELKLAEMKDLQWTAIGHTRPDQPKHWCVLEYGPGIKPVTIMGFSDEPEYLEREARFWSGKDY